MTHSSQSSFAACRRIAAVALTALTAAGLSFANAAQGDAPASPVDRSSELTLVSDDFGLADGPAWDGNRALYVPDVKRSLIKRYVPANDEWKVVREGQFKYSASVFSQGKLFVSNNSAARIETFAGNKFNAEPQLVAIADEEKKPRKRPNDLVVDQDGGVYFTLTGQNQVIYVSPDGKSSIAAESAQSPNGITLSPDNKTLYVAAYRPKKIMSFAVAKPGQLSDPMEFAAMDDGEALGADGMAIDRAGNVYCAGATDVWIWAPDGKLLDRIACPTRPINCAFGDTDMRTLYITGFGGLYKQRMKISGVAPEPARDIALRSWNKAPDTSIPEDITAHLNVCYAEYGTRKLLADIFVPQAATGAMPTVVVIHGGGWLKGDKTKFRAMSLDLAKQGFVTAAVEYRLGHEARFPAGIHDCLAAVRFLRANAETYHVDPARIAAVGGSAGGHLAGLMASGGRLPELQGAGGNPEQSSQIQLAIVLAGPLQIASGNVAERSNSGKDTNALTWFGGTFAEQPDLYHLADAHEKISASTCPMFFLMGELDNPARNQPSRDKLKSMGIATGMKTFKDGKHACWNQLPWFTEMNEEIVHLLKEHL